MSLKSSTANIFVATCAVSVKNIITKHVKTANLIGHYFSSIPRIVVAKSNSLDPDEAPSTESNLFDTLTMDLPNVEGIC